MRHNFWADYKGEMGSCVVFTIFRIKSVQIYSVCKFINSTSRINQVFSDCVNAVFCFIFFKVHSEITKIQCSLRTNY